MYMSKNWMDNVWSWDHCFNALALSGSMPRLAWDTFMIMFDYQDEYGALPDIINDHGVSRVFVKPPVHGWTLSKLMERMHLSAQQLEEVYDKLGRLTNWWTVYRAGTNGLPYYYHGNDSGWDNSTAFKATMPISTPELCGYLVLQMRTLARVAGMLGKVTEQRLWNTRADELKQKIVENYWDGKQLFGLDRKGNRVYSQSLLPMMTIAMGEELPDDIRDYVVGNILKPAERGGWLTKWGVATEQPDSEFYVSDGYWRGPIWAPSTLLIADGLYRAGYKQEASMLARRFSELCMVGGFAENYDALTGQGLRDRAYTWTSSSFLVLMRDYLTD
ncbi:MAG TPA: trehalase family glycosidase, partial [Clostridia bacterium]|nr:trehalase family glycosidase [Clostridia bacterium]